MRSKTIIPVMTAVIFFNACKKEPHHDHNTDGSLIPKCSGTSHLHVVNSDFAYALPTAFTPNGDGRNDAYRPEVTSADVTGYEMVIYDDAANKKVFETNSMNMGWDGQSSTGYKHSVQLRFTDRYGKQVDTCTYLYKLSSENGCINNAIEADIPVYIFQDQLDPSTGLAPYLSAERFCP